MTTPSRPKMARLAPSIVNRMEACVRTQKPDEVMARFGISTNSWVKIRSGEPVRESLATRLVERLVREGIIEHADNL